MRRDRSKSSRVHSFTPPFHSRFIRSIFPDLQPDQPIYPLNDPLNHFLTLTRLTTRYSWFITGLGHISLPYSPDRLTNPSITETWITGGRYGLVYADDVYTDGHLTSFSSDQETVLLGLPTAGGRQPEHMVVREGGCRWEDLVGS